MNLNGTDYVDRHNRPTVIQKVGLKAYFINDGEYVDPVEVSGVTIFAATSNMSPSSILDSETGLIASGSDVSSNILMHFAPSTVDVGGALAEDKYDPADAASLSGVYRLGTGKYIVILDGTQDSSGLYGFYGGTTEIENSASSVLDYIDVWTVKMSAGSEPQTFIQDFHLYSDTIFTTTQPIILRPTNRLTNKRISLGSKVNLKVTTDITIENKDLTESEKNIFKDSAIFSPKFLIEKVNEDSTYLPSKVEVSGYSDTSSLIEATSDNTMIMNFDTELLASHPSLASFDSLTGTYRLVAKYTLLDETIVTKPFYFIVH